MASGDLFCAALHAAAAAQPGYDLVPPRHDGPAKSPLTINEKTDEGMAAAERPEDHSMVNSPTDFCFYNHLNKCGSCVMDAGCGFCSEGPPSVKGRCMTGSKKGPTKYAGCKKWHYTVCALHSKPPAYVPAPPPAPKAIVEKPLVAEKKVQVLELPTNATKLTPWKVEQEVEAPVVQKKEGGEETISLTSQGTCHPEARSAKACVRENQFPNERFRQGHCLARGRPA